MTRHDGESPAPDASSQPTEQPSTGSGATETTGTWAFVSPFAASPGPYLPPAASSESAPAEPPGWGGPVPAEPPAWGAPPAAGPNGPRPSRWKTWQKITAGGVLAGVIAIGGVAAVSAANASSNSDVSQAGFAGGGQGFGGGESGRADGGGLRGGMAGAMALADALHGDFVVSSGSGTRTMRMQVGELTAPATDSITVTSTDGYTSTYAIGSGVDVSGLTQGSTVRVLATVDGDAATATSVTSGTGGFGGGAGEGRGGSGMQPPAGLSPQGPTSPDDSDQAPPTS